MMIRHGHSAPGLCLVLLLTSSLTPKLAHAEDGSRNEDRPIRLYANATLGLIGKVMGNSLGGSAIRINGRLAHEEQTIWNGDFIEAPANPSANVLLDSVGQITLKSGAQVRLATTLTKPGDNITRPVLVASLLKGDMVVKLQQEAIAHIEAGGSVFSTTPGARFRIGVLEGRLAIEMARGDESIEQERRARIKARDVQVRPDGTIVEVATVPLKTKANKVTQDRIRWMKSLEGGGGRTFTFVAFRGSPSGAQAAPGEEPVRGRLVFFEVVPPNLATIQPATTDARGIVTYTFNAGPNAGSGQIKATIKGDPEDPQDTIYETYSRDFNIEKLGPWRLRNKILIAIAAATIVCAVGCHPRNGPIKQQPPPTIP